MDFSIVRLLLYIAPMYFANSSAMMFGGGRHTIDFGMSLFDGRPLFGSGKTYRGLAAGVILGTVVSAILYLAFPEKTKLLTDSYIMLGFLLSCGALLGDLAKSFFKRRLGIGSGKDMFLFDQLDFVAGAIVFGLPLYVPNIIEVVVIAALTIIVHRASNYIAFRFKLKKVPW